jgi:FkbM family methyltransferase
MRWLAAKSVTRKLMNVFYDRLSFGQMRIVHSYYSGIFRDQCLQFDPGLWTIKFAGRRIVLPLTRQRIWLDWETALSILGHEVEIKETYARLIESSQRPELFIDIGANYGTHSLLFLANKIDSISFEPNESCHAYLKEACSLNGLKPVIQGVALGDKDGWAELYFPEHATWMGSTNVSSKSALESRYELITRKVEQRTLDSFMGSFGNRRLLIKIDTEGNEYNVLQGAKLTLQKYRPPVIFESFRNESRTALFVLFNDLNYGLANLPWSPDSTAARLGRSEFLESSSENFIALPSQLSTVKQDTLLTQHGATELHETGMELAPRRPAAVVAE